MGHKEISISQEVQKAHETDQSFIERHRKHSNWRDVAKILV